MRRVLSEVGSEIPDMNALTQLLKFKLGFADLAEPTPEILKNYMDVSNSPTVADPSAMLAGRLSLLGVGALPALLSHRRQEGEGGRDVDPVGEIHDSCTPNGLVGGCRKLLPIIAKLKILVLIIIIITISNPLPPKQEPCNFCDLFLFPCVTN